MIWASVLLTPLKVCDQGISKSYSLIGIESTDDRVDADTKKKLRPVVTAAKEMVVVG